MLPSCHDPPHQDMIPIMFADVFTRLITETNTSLSLKSGDRLFCRGDLVQSAFLLKSGCVDLRRSQADGAEFVLNRATPGSVLAEASLYSDRYHCDGDCAEDAEIAVLPKARMLSLLRTDPDLAAAWAAQLARSLQGARQQAELLRRNKVQQRLTGWLDWHGNLPPKGTRRALAAELGVSPEALYRAIRAMGLKGR